MDETPRTPEPSSGEDGTPRSSGPPGFPPPPQVDPNFRLGVGAPSPTGVHPLSVGRNLQLSWSIFRFGWRTLLAIGLMVLGPALVLMAVVSPFFSPLVNDWLNRTDLATRAGLLPPPFPDGFVQAVIVLVLLTLVLVLASILASGALTLAIDAMYRGQPASATAAVRGAATRFGALLGAQILYFVIGLAIVFVAFVMGFVLVLLGGVATFVGLIVIVAGFAGLLFIAGRLSLMVQAIVLERAGPVGAFGRSWRLVSGSGWRVLGYLLLSGVISTLLGALLQLLPTALLRLDPIIPRDVLIGTLVDGVASIVLLPLIPLVFTLLYYDLRWKRGEPVPVAGGESAAPPGAAETR